MVMVRIPIYLTSFVRLNKVSGYIINGSKVTSVTLQENHFNFRFIFYQCVLVYRETIDDRRVPLIHKINGFAEQESLGLFM